MTDINDGSQDPEQAPPALPKMDRRSFLLSLSGGAFVVASGGLLAGCGGGGGGGNGGSGQNNSGSGFPTATPAAVTQTINDAAGGTISVPNTAGGTTLFSVTFPAGYFGVNTPVTITPISNASASATAPAGYTVVSPFAYSVSTPTQLSPNTRQHPHIPGPPGQASVTIGFLSGATNAVIGENFGGTPPLQYSPDNSGTVTGNTITAPFFGPGVTYVVLGTTSSSSTSGTSSSSSGFGSSSSSGGSSSSFGSSSSSGGSSSSFGSSSSTSSSSI